MMYATTPGSGSGAISTEYEVRIITLPPDLQNHSQSQLQDPQQAIAGVESIVRPGPRSAPPLYTPLNLCWDDEKDEPFLPLKLRDGLEGYRLTPSREEDGEDMVRLWNDPQVGKWSQSRPYPYTKDHISRSFALFLRPVRAQIPLLKTFFLDSNQDPDPSRIQPRPLPWVLKAVRNPSGQFIGNVIITPYTKGGSTAEDVLALPPKEQVWEMSYDLLPEYQGKGIGREMIRAGVEWPTWCGIGKLMATIEPLNKPSEAVIRRHGFVQVSVQMEEWPEHNGGGEREVGLWVKVLP